MNLMRTLFRKRSAARLSFVLVSLGLGALVFIYHSDLAKAASLIISEVKIGSEESTSDDFVKIYNNSNAPFDLKGLRLIKRAKTSSSDTSLKSWTSEAIIPTGASYIWANNSVAAKYNADAATSGTLAEDNCLAIRQGAQDTGEIIDYLDWGECIQFGPAVANPAKGQIITRTIDNSLPITISSSTANGGSGIATSNQTSGQLRLNEIYPWPKTGEVEWLELFYTGNDSPSLAGWSIEDSTGTKTNLSNLSGKYLLIEKPKGSLNNSGDSVILKDDKGQIVDEISYGNNLLAAPEAGQSLAREIDGLGQWKISTKITPNYANSTELVTTEKKNKSTPEQKHGLMISEIYPWPNYGQEEFIELYNNSGEIIDLTNWLLVVDDQQIYNISSSSLGSSSLKLIPDNYFVIKKSQSKLSLINQKGEVKLYSPGKKSAWQSVSYKLDAPGLSWSWEKDNSSPLLDNWRPSTSVTAGKTNRLTQGNQKPIINFDCPKKLTLNNDYVFDASDCYDPEQLPISINWDFGDGMMSTYAIQDHSYAKPGNYQLTLSISDGELNSIKNCSIVIVDISSTAISKTTTVKKSSKIVAKKSAVKKAKTSPKKKTSISKKSSAKKSSKKSTITLEKVSGTVSCLPGDVASQYFYIIPNQGAAIQIYSYYKKFPKLQLGQIIEVNGEKSSIDGNGVRLKIKQAEQIKIIRNGPALKPKNKKISDISKEDLGQPITIAGQVVSKRGTLSFIDDGSGEILVSLPQKTGTKNGDEVTATGILRLSQGSFRLIATNSKLINSYDTSDQNDKQISTSSIILPAVSPKQNNWWFLLIGTSLIITGLYIKFKKDKK